MTRVLSGIQPSGKLHLGNYAGAIRQFLDLQAAGHELYVFVASYHALTTVHDAAAMRDNCRQVVLDYLAYGLDPARTHLYLQHDVPEVTELCWLLSAICPVPMMENAVSYKDKIAKGITPNMALMTYPVLQTADILAVDAEIVPVGKDQVQHLEIARDLAGKFNHEFKAEVFTVPKYRLAADAAVVPGTDGEKMSKSYGNTIDPFAEEKALRKTIMGITTDSTPMEAAKDPETCTVYQIYRAIAGADDARTAALAARYRAGGMGYGHAKQALFELVMDHFAAARLRRKELEAQPEVVDRALASGAAAARARAKATVARARAAVGLA
jgi:tryptophanyl-tRNA synthetase